MDQNNLAGDGRDRIWSEWRKSDRELDEEAEDWNNKAFSDQEREFLSEYYDQVPRKKSEDLEEELSGYQRLPNMDNINPDQSAIMQEQKEEIAHLKDTMQEMKEMMKNLLNHQQTPRNIPLPETPVQRGTALRFATSTPFTERTAGLDTTIRGDTDSLLDTPAPTPESSQFRSRSEIKLPDEERGIVLDTKKINLHFDGSEVELFIKRVEKVASLYKAGGRDVALQLPFMIKDRKISECIENMEGHENRDWELLKKELIRKWGRATPLRRFNENSVSELISKYVEKGGVQTKQEYRTFIGELEEILAYLKKMEYEDINEASGEPLWKAISIELRRDVARELAHEKKLKKTKDGKALVPKLEMLKDYVEASLSVLDLEESTGAKKSATKPSESKTSGSALETKKEVRTQSSTGGGSEKFTQLEEEIRKLRTELNTNQNTRSVPPHMLLNRPPAVGLQPFNLDGQP